MAIPFVLAHVFNDNGTDTTTFGRLFNRHDDPVVDRGLCANDTAAPRVPGASTVLLVVVRNTTTRSRDDRVITAH